MVGTKWPRLTIEALEPRLMFSSVPAWTSVTLGENYSAVIVNQPVVFTATVSPVSGNGTPTGTVAFISGNQILGSATLSAAIATLVSAALPQGSDPIVAVYEGDANFAGSASVAATETVDPSTIFGDGLQEGTTQIGTGDSPATDGQTLEVDYTGYLTNGTVFDSTEPANGTPLDFTLGEGQVIAGWDQGLVGMDVGETRTLIIPPSLGYGSTAQNNIPANSTLIFTVTLDQFIPPRLTVADAAGGDDAEVLNDQAPFAANGTDFGSVAVGQSSAVVTYILAPGNAAPLEFTANPEVQISGADPDDFILTQPVTSNGQTTITLTFTPQASGTRTAIITIPTNDQIYPDFFFNVTGVGT
jgi:hypothetical protein